MKIQTHFHPKNMRGRFPPAKASHIDPTPQSDSDEEIEDEEEEEFNLIEALNDMSLSQRRKVYALKGLLAKHRELRRQFKEEMYALELKFLAEDKLEWEDRRKIVAGERDVTAEEIAAATAEQKESTVEEIPSSDDEKEDGKKRKGVKVVTPAEEQAKSAVQAAGESQQGGIPDFWLTAMKNNEVLEGMISERDEAALRFLQHIDTDYIDADPRKGFTLTFHFAKNEFFTNTTLTKKYFMLNDETTADDDDQTLDKIEGCEIDWTAPEKKLTVIIKQKKQRHKSGKGVRIVQREEKCQSFFNFFTAPVEPEDEDEEDEEELPYEEALEMDYEAGLAFRQSLVPRAVHYYSGKAIEEIAAGLNLMGGDSDEEGEEEEEEEESEEEEVQAPRGRGRGAAQPPAKRGGGKQPECKQQ